MLVCGLGLDDDGGKLAAVDEVVEVAAVDVEVIGKLGNVWLLCRTAEALEQIVLAGQPLGEEALAVAGGQAFDALEGTHAADHFAEAAFVKPA
jgi:hypothetical protein